MKRRRPYIPPLLLESAAEEKKYRSGKSLCPGYVVPFSAEVGVLGVRIVNPIQCDWTFTADIAAVAGNVPGLMVTAAADTLAAVAVVWLGGNTLRATYPSRPSPFTAFIIPGRPVNLLFADNLLLAVPQWGEIKPFMAAAA